MSNSEKPPPKMSRSSWLPNDVAISCMARVSRRDHAALSLVSKSCRSQVASSELYKTRSLMSHTETYVYVCLRIPSDINPRWYILRRSKTLEYAAADLIPIPSFPSQSPEASSVVVMDWGIYVIGGLIKGKPTSDVLLLDCRTHRWSKLSSMGVARSSAAAGVVEGKIYVLGGCGHVDPSKWGEVFDPKTQTWDTLVPVTNRNVMNHIHDSVVWNQKVYAVGGLHGTFYYSPREGRWGRGSYGGAQGNKRDWCMIDDNLIYFCGRDGRIFWYEAKDLEGIQMNSNEVKGLNFLKESLSRSRLVHFGEHILDVWNNCKIKYGISRELVEFFHGFRLCNNGGNIVLFWDEIVGDSCKIWCAEISLEKRGLGGEIWGKMEWSHVVMTLDPFVDHYKVLYSVSVTL